MAEESEQEGERPHSAPIGASHDPVAFHIALNAASQDEARDYLRKQAALAEKQSRVADLQMENLKLENVHIEQIDEFEMSHLRFRRLNDFARALLQSATGAIAFIFACALGSMLWSAVNDHDLVMDQFSVPPEVANSGMTGAVLAGRVLDRFGRLQNETVSTVQGAESYRADNVGVPRVEIPNTGISLDEVNRYLRTWLGNETHVTGDLVRTAKGLALTVRYGNQPGFVVEGTAADLDRLVDRTAEQIFEIALPYRYVEYLTEQGRFGEASAMVPGLAAHGSKRQRALAYTEWAVIYSREGNIQAALDKSRQAVQLDPANGSALSWLAISAIRLGHDEEERSASREMVRHWHDTSNAGVDPDVSSYGEILFTANADDAEGDFRDALVAWAGLSLSERNLYDLSGYAADAASNHDLGEARKIATSIAPVDRDGKPNFDAPLTQFLIAWSAADWPQALRLGIRADTVMSDPADSPYRNVLLWPQLAYAMARNGNVAGAQTLIAKTAADCDICMRMRGRLASLNQDWTGAARLFAVVAARSPHSPFAETDWGEMLLGRGDTNGAIVKFRAANAKGPKFADPLEMWGEALMLQNRSDLALAKFEEAAKYASNWGRLHLEWGEALFYAGKPAEARQQFVTAGSLDLTSADKAQLARWNAARH